MLTSLGLVHTRAAHLGQVTCSGSSVPASGSPQTFTFSPPNYLAKAPKFHLHCFPGPAPVSQSHTALPWSYS